MTMLQRIGRLFIIKTRTEVWFVIYAMTLGAIERGRDYMEVYPGNMGVVLALACTGVVFLAGAKLLDSVKPVEQFLPAAAVARSSRRVAFSRSRPRVRQTRFGSRSPLPPRTGSRPTTRP